jgi:hypothetical protein
MAVEPLRPYFDIDIMAALRPERIPDRIAAVRWTSRPVLGFPASGYGIWRREVLAGGGVARSLVGTFYLPATDSWSAFEADLLARAPIAGPYFDTVTEADLGFLLPLVRAVDPRIPLVDRLALLPEVADFFGYTHTAEPFYLVLMWNKPVPATFDDLIADPVAGPVITAFYGLEVMKFLEALAIRYEYALLLGLGVEDDITGLGNVVYELAAWWGPQLGASMTPVIDGLALSPTRAAQWVRASVVDGNVGHPAFARTSWDPPDGYVPVDGAGAPVGVGATYPRPYATQTALAWDLTPSDDVRLLKPGQPVSFRVRSFEHGASTAGEPTPPPAPSTRRFRDIVPSVLHVPVKGSATQAVDGAGRSWPPLEGWVHYRVWGVSLLAIESDQFAETAVLHADAVAPPPPRIRVVDQPSVTFGADRTVSVPVRLELTAAEDFPAADAVELRIEASWQNTGHAPIAVVRTSSTTSTAAVIEVAGAHRPQTLVGGRLEAAGRSHRILDATATTLTVTLHAGAAPPAGAAMVLHTERIGATTRIAAVERPLLVKGMVGAVIDHDPLTVVLPLGARRPRGEVSLYLHLLRSSVTARAEGDRWVVVEPAAPTPAGRALRDLRAAGRLAADLPGSPFVLYPAVEDTLRMAVPAGFESGTLTLAARASDRKPYVTGPVVPSADPALAQLDGNEGDSREATVGVRSAVPPRTPTVLAAPPVAWATSATPYDPVARFEVRWAPAAGAVRYEVWRLLESALAPRPGGRTDAELLVDAVAASAEFELRTDQAWSTSHLDELPGRAPARAVYLVRSVSAAGVASAFSPPIGPVHIPDVRPPAAAEVAAVRRAVPTATDDGARQVRVDLAGPELGGASIGCVVERRPADGSSPWVTVADLAPPLSLTAGERRPVVRVADADVQPGIDHHWRVVPYRVVPDPIDETGRLTRTIRGRPSTGRAGRSTGELLAPAAPRWSAGGGATLTWRNPDLYDRIVVERLVGGSGPARVLAALDGTSTEFTDRTNRGPTATGAGYSYRLRCSAGTASTSTRVEGVVGAP